MKKVEEWIADAEEKIAEGRKRQKLRAERIKKATVIMSCLVLLIGVAFAVPYAMKDDSGVSPPDVLTDVDSDTDISTESSQTVPNTTADATESTPAESTEQPNPWPYGTVSYKNEDGTYSWDDVKGMGGEIGGTPYICPEGHYLSGGPYGSYHNDFPPSLIMSLPEYEEDNLYYIKYRYPLVNYSVKYLCNGNTIKAFIDEYNITREHFDKYVDLVEYSSYNLEILFGDKETADEYYKYHDIFEERRKMSWNYTWLTAVIANKYNMHDRKDELGWLGNGKLEDGTFRYYNASLPEIAYMLKLSREELESLIIEISEEEELSLHFDYDFSVIYDEDGNFREELSILDTRNSTPEEIMLKSSELSEEFCRIYDWKDPESFNDTFYEDNKSFFNSKPYYIYVCDCFCIGDLGWDIFGYYFPEDEYDSHERSGFKDELDKHSKFLIKSLINKFDISEEEFNSLLKLFIDDKFSQTWIADTRYYDYDLFRYGTDDEIEAYYSSFEHRKAHYKYSSLSTLRIFIKNHYCDSEGKSLRGNGSLALPEIIQKGEISREELIAIIEEARLREEASQIYYGGEFCSYDYNLDVIYNEDGSFRDLSGYDKNTLELMFCGLLEYAAE